MVVSLLAIAANAMMKLSPSPEQWGAAQSNANSSNEGGLQLGMCAVDGVLEAALIGRIVLPDSVSLMLRVGCFMVTSLIAGEDCAPR